MYSSGTSSWVYITVLPAKSCSCENNSMLKILSKVIPAQAYIGPGKVEVPGIFRPSANEGSKENS